MDENKQKREHGEDATKYGEFVCSEYHWLPMKKQKEQANRLENITKRKTTRIKEKRKDN